MRKEYIYNEYNYSLCLNAIRDFMSNVPDYTMIRDVTTRLPTAEIPRFDRYTYTVFKKNDKNIYVIFFSTAYIDHTAQEYIQSNFISMLVTTSFDEAKHIWNNDNILWNKTTFMSRTDYSSEGVSMQTKNYFNYAPVPSLFKINKLVCNYDEDSGNILITGIRDYEVEYEQYTDIRTETYNICFGEVVKFLEYEGGFFYGGDFYTTLEVFHRVANSYNSPSCYYQYSIADIIESPNSTNYARHSVTRRIGGILRTVWDDAVSEGAGNSDGIFHFNLLAGIDNSENRDVRRLSDIIDSEDAKILDNAGASEVKLTDSNLDIEIRNFWVTTLDIPYYMNMHTTFEQDYNKLPTLWSLMSEGYNDLGHTVGTLSKISLLMPLHFYVRREPLIEELYSHAGEAVGIKFVNMLYMSTDSIKELDFPVPGAFYNCFNSGHRRNKSSGYNGIAIKINDIEGDE